MLDWDRLIDILLFYCGGRYILCLNERLRDFIWYISSMSLMIEEICFVWLNYFLKLDDTFGVFVGDKWKMWILWFYMKDLNDIIYMSLM